MEKVHDMTLFLQYNIIKVLKKYFYFGLSKEYSINLVLVSMPIFHIFQMVNKLCLWNTNAPAKAFFFSKTELDIWPCPWQMTLTLVLKKGFYPREYMCKIWKVYHLPLKSYGQFKSSCGQTNWRTDKGKGQKLYAPDLSMRGA